MNKEKKAIVLSVEDRDKYRLDKNNILCIDYLKKKFSLKSSEINELQPAYLFNLGDNIRLSVFNATLVFWNSKKEKFYPTEISNVIKAVSNEDIVALVDDKNESFYLKA